MSKKKSLSQTRKVKAAREAYHSSTKESKNIEQAKQKLTDAYIAEGKGITGVKHCADTTSFFLQQDDRKGAWLKHFSALLGKPPSVPDRDY